MSVKHFYLVRHGETVLNQRKIHSPLSTPLNEYGKRQAQAAAKALSQFSIDALITSDAVRAQETAAPIAAMTHTIPYVNPMFRELRRSDTVEHTYHFGFRSIVSSALMYLHSRNRLWHYENGENFIEFRERVIRALELLAQTDGEHIVVISHRGVINALRFGIRRGFTGPIGKFMFAAVLGHLKNGSITKLTYESTRITPWHIER